MVGPRKIAAIVWAVVLTAGCGARTGLPDAVPDAGSCPLLTAWQWHDSAGPECISAMLNPNADPSAYASANIPSADDPGWSAANTVDIEFQRGSRLCNVCACRLGVDFDYWQAFLTLPHGFAASSFTLSVATLDDGVRISVFNDAHPAGADAFLLAAGTTDDLASSLAPGDNRIVLTHLDDCCVQSFMRGVALLLNGQPAGSCP
jgi:hypothetical protein